MDISIPNLNKKYKTMKSYLELDNLLQRCGVCG